MKQPRRLRLWLPVATLVALATAVAFSFPANADTSGDGSASSDDGPGIAIVGGGTVTDEKPWIAALHGNGSFTCTSSQISAEWVITAAHCVESDSAFSVRIGSLTRSSGGTERSVDAKYLHPDYDWPNHDIALLHLSEPFDNQYAPLATEADLQDGQASTIYGWGSENPDWSGPLPENLKYSDGYTRADTCSVDGVVCMVGDGGVAGGDSGGPGFVQSAVTGEYVQVGVCAIGEVPASDWSGYTSIPHHQDWIDSVVG